MPWSSTDPVSARSPDGTRYEVRVWPSVAPVNLGDNPWDAAVRLWGRLRLRIGNQRDLWLVLITKREGKSDLVGSYPPSWRYGPWGYREAVEERGRRVSDIEHGNWAR
jgi:hypothetical protein